VVQQAALAYPSVHFRLTHQGQEVLNYSAVASDRDRILQVYGQAFLEKTIDVRGRIAGCALSGLMIDPVHARATKAPQDLFVNRRPVRNATVFHAVNEGYGSLLAKGRHPTYVLFLDIDPERIDVNVHPAKREIRFADQEGVHRFVRHSVRHAFGGAERKAVLNLAGSDPAATTPLLTSSAGTGFSAEPSDWRQAESSDQRATSTHASLFAAESTLPYRTSQEVAILPLGQMLQTYLIAQVGRELHVIDQHTAHERVLFQRLWRSWTKREITTQPLLIPESIDLTAAQYSLLQKYTGDVEQLGLVLEPFGAGTVLLRAVPAGLGPLDGASVVREVLEELAEWASVSSMDARAHPVFATLACKSAIQAGRTMTLPEIEQLVRDWVDEGVISTCPHGRRTAFRLAADELDSLFGRTGWS
jgi:DNA mismatch repair protein MutL